jgi:peptidoglycan/LPS O-acetylase OafA/YrhL
VATVLVRAESIDKVDPGKQPRAVRIEIQALRALAVSLVVLYHLSPARLSGGYVGVDVFFVVSGFLITGHLMREVERTGRIRLADFWGRRARRLLPAALVVLLVSSLATLLFVPQTNWQAFLRETVGSALYVENWLLASDAVDYLAADNVASPAQHYWSLSTEEQFYLVWPLLILCATWLAQRSSRRPQLAVAGVLATVTAVSFGWSAWATVHATSLAYFATPARAWEFGAGGLLAVLAPKAPHGREMARTIVSWAGFLAIAWTGFAFSGATAFPGTAALIPVLGTVAVIWAGAPRHAWSPTKAAEFAPVHFLGDISYSAYLWHWPMIVILPYVLGHELGAKSKLGVLAVTVAAAWLTKVLVEDPVRTGTPLARRGTGATFLATAVATGLVVATATAGFFYVQAQVDRARASAAAFAGGGDPCFGAGAMDPARQCAHPFTVTDSVNTTFAKTDLSAGMKCLVGGVSTELRACRHTRPGSTRTIALIGDSHAASWWEAVTAMADDQHWSVVMYAHAGCPSLSTDRYTGPTMPADQPPACRAWSRQVIETIAADPAVTTVMTGYRSDIYKYRSPDGHLVDAFPAPVVQAAFERLVAANKQIYVLRAFPTTNGAPPDADLSDFGRSSPDCIAASGVLVDPCAGRRTQRVTPDSIATGVRGIPRARVLDLTDYFCDPTTCHTVIGGTVVYWDTSHITATFSRSLAPFLLLALQRAGG